VTAYDVRARASAARALAPIASGGKGQPITLTRVTNGDYDEATGTIPQVTTTQTGSGAVFEYTTFIRSGVRNEPGTLILAGDKQLLLSPFKADGTPLDPPQTNDTVTFDVLDGAGNVIGTKTATITALAPLSPAGVAVYFECNIRGA
jgi:hypothetical protein